MKNRFCRTFFNVKGIILLAASLLLTSSVFAGRPDVEIKKGDWKAIVAKSSTAKLVLDFSKCQVGFIDDGEFEKGKDVKPLQEYLKGRGEDFVNDWPGDVKKIANYFETNFNRKNKKGLQVKQDAPEATYTVKIIIEKLDVGNPVGIGFSAKSGGAIIAGVIEVVNNETGEIECEIAINEMKGVSTFSETDRIGFAFMELGKAVAKLKK